MNDQAAYRLQKRVYLDGIKTDAGCAHCGLQGLPACVYDFHHRDPAAKVFALSKAFSRGWKAIEIEVAKCDILCANCHRQVDATTSP